MTVVAADHAHAHAHIHAHTHAHTHTHTNARTHARTHARAHTRKYTHECTRTNTHTHKVKLGASVLLAQPAIVRGRRYPNVPWRSIVAWKRSKIRRPSCDVLATW